MKKLSEKTRKLLRKIYIGIGAGVVALGLQACPKYGMPPDDDPVFYPMYGPPANEVNIDEK